MGIDVEIYFESKDGLEPTDLQLPEGYDVKEAPDYQRGCGATHCIDTLSRYYGDGYERGPWVYICAVLMSLFASSNVGKVWYFGDCQNGPDEVHPITIEDVLEISRHYMLNGERPYRQNAVRIKVEASISGKE